MFEITRMNAEGLARIGFEVAIAYGRRRETPGEVRTYVDESVELIPMPWDRRSLAAQVRAQVALRRLLKSWRPDIVHLMSSFAGLHGAVATGGIPTVYTPQAYAFTMASEPAWKRWAYLIAESFIASRVSLVGACSLSEGEQARSLPGSGAVSVVPNGIDELSQDRIGTSPRPRTGPPRVIATGRPLPQRQPAACAAILSAVATEAAVAWVGGGDPRSPGYKSIVDAGIPMTGWMSRSETLEELASSTVYLHWTAWDGLPLSVLEALALDVIVVASDIGPNREILGSEQVCRTEDEAVHLILRVLRDDSMRTRLLSNQRERRAAYGADAMVERWSSVYGFLT